MSTLAKAISIAAIAHGEQKRKTSNIPYLFHPLRVMLAASRFGQVYAIVAILHDTIEDTDLSIADLAKEGFSEEVLNAVRVLTKTKGLGYIEYLNAVKANHIALIVKLLDIEDNMSDLETLGTFEPEQEHRLRLKYENALAILRS